MIFSYHENYLNHSPLQMPEGKDLSWNFVEIDSASDLMAMENPRQSRTQVNSESGPRGAVGSRQMIGDENATENEFQARLNSTRSMGKERFRELIRRKKGLRRRVVKGRNKLARLDDNEITRDKEASGQAVGEKKIAVPREREKHAEETFISSLNEEDIANKDGNELSRKAEERSYPEEEVARQYYPSGSRREQLLDNERVFLTSAEDGDLNQCQHQNIVL